MLYTWLLCNGVATLGIRTGNLKPIPKAFAGQRVYIYIQLYTQIYNLIGIDYGRTTRHLCTT